MSGRVDIAAAAVTALRAVEAGMPVQTDVNLPFDPPSDAPWARLSFVDGAAALKTIGGPGASVERAPLIAYADVFVPQGEGDGRATELGEAVKDGWRFFNDGAGTRWRRFEQGPEGASGPYYRKQIVAVFWRDHRV